MQTPSSLTAIVSALSACLLTPAYANPSGGTVVSGSATFASSGHSLTITNSPGTIIDWHSFSINKGELTQFIQQSATSQVLNHITGGDPSQILGSLQSNGQVFLINPNGIVFGADAKVDVAGLVVSTLNLSNDNFLAGRLNFDSQNNAGDIKNQGTITSQGGQIIMIAPKIENSGIISAANGDILLAAGKTVSIVDMAHPDISIDVSAVNQVINLGQLLAKNISLYGSIIDNSGEINANTAIVAANGSIILDAQENLTTSSTSTISANGVNGGNVILAANANNTIAGKVEATGTQNAEAGVGGNITFLGNQITLKPTANIDASGSQAGGTVLVGGDEHGQATPALANVTGQLAHFSNAVVAVSTPSNANTVIMTNTAQINADAQQTGNGGKIILWSENNTNVAGQISAKGGKTSGDGGFVETSGKNYLDVNTISPDLTAKNGHGGTWLLDPNNITIQATGSDSNITGNPNFVSNNDTSIITTNTIETALNHGVNVAISTGSGGTNTEAGDINVNAAIVKSAGADASLSLSAYNNLNLNNSITSSVGKLDMLFTASNGSVNLANGNAISLDSNGGSINASGQTLNLASGSATINALLTASSLNLTGGDLILNAAARLGEVNLNGGNLTDNASLTIDGNLNPSGSLAFNFSDGSLLGNGTLAFANGGQFLLTGSGDRLINAENVSLSFNNLDLNSGSLSLQAGQLTLNSTPNNSTLFDVNSSFNQQGGTLLINGSFTNAGNMNLLGGAVQGTASINNTGNLTLSAITLPLSVQNQGVVSANNVNFNGLVTNNAELDLSANNQFTGGLQLANNSSINGSNNAIADLNQQALLLPNQGLVSINNLSLTNIANSTIPSNTTLDANNDNFSGSGVVTVNGTLNLTNSTIANPINNTGLLLADASVFTGAINNTGTANLTNNTVENVINNGIVNATGNNINTLTNATTFNSTQDSIANLNNSGTASISNDTITTFSNTGSSNLTDSSVVTLTNANNGTLSINGSVSAGEVNLTGGTISLNDGANLITDGSLNPNGSLAFNFVNGTLNGNGNLSFINNTQMLFSGIGDRVLDAPNVNLAFTNLDFPDGSLTLASGQMTLNATQTGQSSIGANSIFNQQGGNFIVNSPLNIAGQLNLLAGNYQNTFNNTITNSGEMSFSNTSLTTPIINDGVFTANNVTFNGLFTNNNQLTLAGTDNFMAGLKASAGSSISSNNIATANLNNQGLLLEGQGNVNITNINLIHVSDLNIATGQTLNLDNVSLSGSAVIGVNGVLDLNNTTINNQVDVTATGSLYQLAGLSIINKDLNNAGNLNVQNGTLEVKGGSESGQITISSDANLSFAGNNTFSNDAIQNSGNLIFAKGNASFTEGFTQTGGQTSLIGGTINGTVTLTKGVLTGSGAINGDLNVLAATLSPTKMSVSGDLNLSANSHFNVNLGGTSPGLNYSYMDVANTANLAGTLNVQTATKFTPQAGSSYGFMNFNTNVGNFSNVSLPTLNMVYFASNNKLFVDVPTEKNPISEQTGNSSQTNDTTQTVVQSNLQNPIMVASVFTNYFTVNIYTNTASTNSYGGNSTNSSNSSNSANTQSQTGQLGDFNISYSTKHSSTNNLNCH